MNDFRGRHPLILLFFAVLGAFSAVFHAFHVVFPSGETPIWRHTVFVGINIFFVWGMIHRPKYFEVFLWILTLQQLFSHGTYLVRHFQEAAEVHWISAGVVVLMPICLIFYLKNPN